MPQPHKIRAKADELGVSEEQLIAPLAEKGMTSDQIGTAIGVSAGAIRHWFRHHGWEAVEVSRVMWVKKPHSAAVAPVADDAGPSSSPERKAKGRRSSPSANADSANSLALG